MSIYTYVSLPTAPVFPFGRFLGGKTPGQGVGTLSLIDSPNCTQNSYPDQQAHQRIHTLTATFQTLTISTSSFLTFSFRKKKDRIGEPWSYCSRPAHVPTVDAGRASPAPSFHSHQLAGQAFYTHTFMHTHTLTTHTHARTHTHTHMHTHTQTISVSG